MALLGATAFSGKAIIAKLAYRHGVDAITVIMFRMLFALPLFLLLAVWAQRRALAQGLPALTRRDAAGIVWLGFVGYYLSSTLDFLGLQYITASLERLILYLNPTLVLLLGMVFLKQRIASRQWLAMAVSYSGMVLVFGHEAVLQGPDTVWGGVLVLFSAASYAVYLTHSGELVKRVGTLRLTGWASSVACVLCLVQFVVLKPWSAVYVPAPVLWLSVFNATACTVLPVVLVMGAIARLGPGLTAQTGMVGPMATLLLGVMLLDEPFNGWILAGTALVLGGVFLVMRSGPAHAPAGRGA
jgi:drug/metabolite transporter (DMT)-like permease